MSIRDLGYRSYEGTRLPWTHNTWVLLRHGLRRTWSSRLVKVATVFAWAPALVTFLYALAKGGLMELAQKSGQSIPTLSVDVAAMVQSLLGTQLWLFVFFIAMGAGATVIARDRQIGAFAFYLSKPVRPFQYLLANGGAVILWCVGILFFPAALFVGALSAVRSEPEHLWLLLPTFLLALLTSVAVSMISIGVSATSKSRGFTMSLWVVVFVVPEVLGALMERTAMGFWSRIASVPSLLDAIGRGLFRQDDAGELPWSVALVSLTFLVAGTAWAAHRQVTLAEVVR
ncbi:MAG: ABC transporter permease subunit [Myxococcales bacterium]|nr:ABC transporter permease subunit [Myxococcales bacterium]